MNNALDVLFEFRNVALDGIPDNIPIEAKILVDENVTHANDGCPRNVWMPPAGYVVERTRRFTDHLQVVNDPHS